MKAEEFMTDVEAVLGLCLNEVEEQKFLEVLEQYYDPIDLAANEWGEYGT